MLVIRDTVDGTCRLLDFNDYELDIQRLEEGGWEVAGELDYHQEVSYTEDDSNALQFTTCEHVVNPHIAANDNAKPNRFCQRWILIIDDGAPEYCSDHEPFHEDE